MSKVSKVLFEFVLIVSIDEEFIQTHSTLLNADMLLNCYVVKNTFQSALEFLALGRKLGREPDLILLDFDGLEKECNDFWRWYFFTNIMQEKNVLVIYEEHFEIKHIIPRHFQYLRKPLCLETLRQINWPGRRHNGH